MKVWNNFFKMSLKFLSCAIIISFIFMNNNNCRDESNATILNRNLLIKYLFCYFLMCLFNIFKGELVTSTKSSHISQDVNRLVKIQNRKCVHLFGLHASAEKGTPGTPARDYALKTAGHLAEKNLTSFYRPRNLNFPRFLGVI